MSFLTTTSTDIDEELLNRYLVMAINESRWQTQAIHAQQRQQQTLEGMLQARGKETLQKIHWNAQRLLKTLMVVNPWAEKLGFTDNQTRTRRDHMKYLTLIRSITLLHQYQRERKTVQHNGETIDYIESTLEDIETANWLAQEVLGHTLDELPPPTRTLLAAIYARVNSHCQAHSLKQKDYRFTRREVREVTGRSDTALKVHMARPVDMEYLLVHRGGRGQSFQYELLWKEEGCEGNRFILGLLDVETLRSCPSRSGQKGGQSGGNSLRSVRGQAEVSPRSGGGQVSENAAMHYVPKLSGKTEENSEKEVKRAFSKNGEVVDSVVCSSPLLLKA
jgi:hypothetical protein